MKLKLLGLIVLIVLPQLIFAGEVSRADTALNTTISDFIVKISTETGSDFYQFIRSMMFGLAFIGLAWQVIKWAFGTIHIGDLAVYALSSILIFTVFLNYDSTMKEFWSWSDAIGGSLQQAAVGNPDPIYIGENIKEAIYKFQIKDASIWDGVHAFIAIFSFKFFTMLLSAVVFISSIWGTWGYAFSKITGLIFLPLLFIPFTRPFFDRWLQIFLGFWFFNLFVKISLTLYHLYFFAIFGVIADPVQYDPIADYFALSKISIHFFVGIFFVIGAGGMAKTMSSGFSSFSQSVSSVAVAFKLAQKLKGIF